MEKSILHDNLLYLQEWMNVNPNLKQNLKVEIPYLIYSTDKETEKQDISNFYLPEMLYNETFRNKLVQELNSLDLFRIIQVYCQAKEVLRKNEEIDQNSPIITNLQIKNEKEKEFLLIFTEDQKKYRFDTEEPEKIINLYMETINKKGKITLKEFGRLIKNDK